MYCPRLHFSTLYLLRPLDLAVLCAAELVGSLSKALFKQLWLCLRTHDEKGLMKISAGRL